MVKMGTVWDRTAEFLTDNLSALLPVCLLAFFVPYSIRGNFAMVSDGGRFDFQLLLQLFSLGFALLALWGSLTISAMVLDSDARDPGVVGVRNLVPALGVAIVMLGGLAIVCAPVPLLLSAWGYDLQGLIQRGGAGVPVAMEWLLSLYLLAVLLLSIWVGARLLIVNPVILSEKRILGALARSWTLTRGMSLRIVGVVLLYLLVTSVAVLATRVVFGSIFELVAGTPTNGLSLSRVLTSVMVAAVQTGFTVVVPTFATKLYLALVQREDAARA